MSDEQDLAEALDADKVDDDLDDGELEPAYPPDELQGADEYGITPADDEVDEPLGERVAREEPDPLVEELDGRQPVGGGADGVGGRIVDVPGGDSSFLDDEDEAVAAVEVGDDGDLTAEEAAVHEDPGAG